VLNPPAFDCLFNEGSPACYLLGDGCFAKDDGTWRFGFDVPLADGFPAQPLFDSVEGYPGAGDSFGYSGVVGDTYNTPMTLRAAAVLRAQAHGITLDDGGARASGTAATMTQSSGTVGTDASDSSGYYATSGNSAKGNDTAEAVVGSSSVVFSGGTIIRKVYSRHRHRASFRIATPGTWISLSHSAAGRIVRGFLKSTVLWLGGATNADGMTWDDHATATTGIARPSLCFDKTTQVLWLVYEVVSGGAIVAAYTSDEGRSITVAFTVNASGTWPTQCIGGNGLHYHFWRTSGGAIEGKIFDGQGTQVFPASGAQTLVASGVADDAIDATLVDATGLIYLEYRSGTSLVTVVSANGGQSYS
jgi:hypothetical protein